MGLGSTAILTLLFPLAARGGIGIVVGLRVLMGLAEGVSFPCVHEIWSKWAPPLERSRMGSIPYAGTYIGMVVSLSTCGILAQNYGWQSVFYVYGVVGCVWNVLWLSIVRGSPEKDRFISNEEKRYIMASLKHTNAYQPKSIPWFSILTSSPVWAIAASQFAENWGLYTMQTQLPQFLKCRRMKFAF